MKRHNLMIVKAGERRSIYVYGSLTVTGDFILLKKKTTGDHMTCLGIWIISPLWNMWERWDSKTWRDPDADTDGRDGADQTGTSEAGRSHNQLILSPACPALTFCHVLHVLSRCTKFPSLPWLTRLFLMYIWPMVPLADALNFLFSTSSQCTKACSLLTLLVGFKHINHIDRFRK